jgi:hypothetical protein
MTAVAAASASVAEMITARVFRAVNANLLGRIAADRAGESRNLHPNLLLVRAFATGRRFSADDSAATLRLLIGDLEILLGAGGQIAYIIPEALAIAEISCDQLRQLIRRGAIRVLPRSVFQRTGGEFQSFLSKVIIERER